MERAFGVLLDRAERPERRRDARVRPTPHRVVSSFPRVGTISIDLIVDASASIARRRAPNAGTLSTDSLILPFFAFSLDAALSPPGRPTVKVRRTRTIGNASHTIRRKRRIAFGFFARGRAVAVATRRGVSSTSIGWVGAPPTPLSLDGWMGVSDVIDGS